jgi:hypothetical protein
MPRRPHLQPPPHSSELKVAFPEKHVLLLTLNRPRSLNAMSPQLTNDLKTVLNWFEEEPELWYVFFLCAFCLLTHYAIHFAKFIGLS